MNKINLPINCPTCNYPLEWSNTGIDLFCHNISCEAKTGRNLLHFFQVIDNIDGFGPKTIENLIENGYDTLISIYNMNYNDFVCCGFGPKESFNLGSELEYSRERKIEDWKFLAALGIPHLGIGNSKTLMKIFTLDQIINSSYICITSELDGFGEKMVYEILINLDKRQEEINNLIALNFNIVKEDNSIIESPITGQNIVFTGKMKNNRKEMEKQAESLGATIQKGVNKNTTFLVIGKKVGINKTNAATKFGTQILTENEYYDLIK